VCEATVSAGTTGSLTLDGLMRDHPLGASRHRHRRVPAIDNEPDDRHRVVLWSAHEIANRQPARSHAANARRVSPDVKLLERKSQTEAEYFGDRLLTGPQADQSWPSELAKLLALGGRARPPGEVVVGFGPIEALDVDPDATVRDGARRKFAAVGNAQMQSGA
jgi:hypothetical protein